MSGRRPPLLTWRRFPKLGWTPARASSVLLALATLLSSLPADADPGTYQVAPGDSLSRIAQRHGTTVAALCRENGLEQSHVLRVGQRLRLPSTARSAGSPPRSSGHGGAKGAGSTPAPTAAPRSPQPSWAPYVRAPERKGYLRLESTVGRWSGQALQGHWEIPESARAGITRVLASWRTGGEERIHGRLIRMLVRISDTFGGRPIRVVCGYRDPSHREHTKHSKHHLGRAIDFSIPGVPNEVVRDFLRHTFDGVGVGYYPNSTHVHLDIRERSTYWVDVSRPGEPPRYVTPLPSTRRPTQADQNASPRRTAAPERQRSDGPRESVAPVPSRSGEESAGSERPEPPAPDPAESPSPPAELELAAAGGEN